MRATLAPALLGIALLLFQPTLAEPLDAIPLKNHVPVLIRGDADWCDRVNAQGYDDDGVHCAEGDGTQLRPFPIEGWRFNMAAYPAGTAAITIENTSRYWVVRNNVITDTREERLRDGLHLFGASDSRGRVEHNRFEHLRTGITATEWVESKPCTLSQGQLGSCMWRKVSAPRIEDNAFVRDEYGVVNGPNLGFASNEATGKIAQNNFDATGTFAYAEVLPTKWKPPLQTNWWGAPTGPGVDVTGVTAGGGRLRAQCAGAGSLPYVGQPMCATPWLPAPNPAAGPLVWLE